MIVLRLRFTFYPSWWEVLTARPEPISFQQPRSPRSDQEGGSRNPERSMNLLVAFMLLPEQSNGFGKANVVDYLLSRIHIKATMQWAPFGSAPAKYMSSG